MKNLIHPKLRELHAIYSPDFPDFLLPFLEAPAMLRLKKIDQNCGYRYSALSDTRIHYSRLEHSLGVALIIYHFTKDPTETLAGLFHDLSHTVFSHAGDFFFGDAIHQESAEQHTTKIISEDPVISMQLRKLGILVSAVDDYAMYPIADNPGPKLSADRFEYTLSTIITDNPDNLPMEKIQEIYDNVIPYAWGDGILELAFRDRELAELFALSSIYNDAEIFSCYRSVTIMQSIAEILKRMVQTNLLTLDDFYTKTDDDIIRLIHETHDTKLRKMWHVFSSTNGYKVHQKPIQTENFLISSKSKRRYIDPLVLQEDGNAKRVSELSEKFRDARDYHLSRREEWIEVPNSSVFLEK